eukprot:scaffold112660_cov29-Tisochrysis_lutea.AAC.4
MAARSTNLAPCPGHGGADRRSNWRKGSPNHNHNDNDVHIPGPPNTHHLTTTPTQTQPTQHLAMARRSKKPDTIERR